MEFRDYEGDRLDVTSDYDDGETPTLGISMPLTGNMVVFESRDSVTRLRDALTRWLETGSVEEKP